MNERIPLFQTSQPPRQALIRAMRPGLWIERRSFATAYKAKGRPNGSSLKLPLTGMRAHKKRRFDAHTISIWSKGMVERGGSTDTALSTLLGRMADGRLPHTTPLYNTALSICAKKGLLSEAARILHQMVGRNVRTDEYSVSSVLNAIAEHAKTLPHSENRESGSVKEMISQACGMPGLEAFDLKSKGEAIDLAMKVYTSWVNYKNNRGSSIYPFNVLLKVIAIAGHKDVLPKIFPPGPSTDCSWIPKQLDKFTFTAAIAACQDDFLLALRYWQAYLERGEPDLKLVKRMTLVLIHELNARRREIGADEIKRRKEFVQELFPMLLKAVEEPIVEVYSNVLFLALRLGLHEEGLGLWKQVLMSVIQKNNSFKKSKQYVNDASVVAICGILIKKKQSSEALDTIEMLRRDYGMHISTSILNVMLRAYRQLGQTDMAGLSFKKYAQRKDADKPDMRTMQQIILCIAEDGRLAKKDRDERIGRIADWFRTHHSDIYSRVRDVFPKLVDRE